MEPGDMGILFESLRLGRLKWYFSMKVSVTGWLWHSDWQPGPQVVALEGSESSSSCRIGWVSSFLKSKPDKVPKIQVLCQPFCSTSCFPIVAPFTNEKMPLRLISSCCGGLSSQMLLSQDPCKIKLSKMVENPRVLVMWVLSVDTYWIRS